MSEMADAIRALSSEKGISVDSVRQTVENTIKAAYKRTFGTSENCIVKFSDNMDNVTVYARKVVVDGVYDPSQEIELEEAQRIDASASVGDEMVIPIDPHTFGRSAVFTGKQTAHQALSESFKDNLYNTYKDRIGKIETGVYQRERKGNIFVELDGKAEGFLPVKNQSPHEVFEKNDRVRAIVEKINKTPAGIQLVLSRTSPDFVKKILESEVTEIADGTVVVQKVVREPGYRTKVAVYSTKQDVDPVGACVGMKGMRIQNVIRELYGEKIDVLKYDEDPHEFIKNSLSPAEVKRVVIQDAVHREALAIVDDSQFSIAIGKQGQNVRLANKLCDWSVNVKTEATVTEEDLIEVSSVKAAEKLFADLPENQAQPQVAENEEDSDDFVYVSQLPGIDKRLVDLLAAAGLNDLEAFIQASDDGSLAKVEGLTEEDLATLDRILKENVEIVEEGEEE